MTSNDHRNVEPEPPPASTRRRPGLLACLALAACLQLAFLAAGLSRQQAPPRDALVLPSVGATVTTPSPPPPLPPASAGQSTPSTPTAGGDLGPPASSSPSPHAQGELRPVAPAAASPSSQAAGPVRRALPSPTGDLPLQPFRP